METEPLISKVTQVIQRENGSEGTIVAQACFGLGLTRSIDVYVLHRESPDQDWVLLSNKLHPDWRAMSVADYMKHGRSEMLQSVSPGEILKLTGMIGKPMIHLH